MRKGMLFGRASFSWRPFLKELNELDRLGAERDLWIQIVVLKLRFLP